MGREEEVRGERGFDLEGRVGKGLFEGGEDGLDEEAEFTVLFL